MTDKLQVRTVSITTYSKDVDADAIIIHTGPRFMIYMSAAEARQLAIDLVAAAEKWDKTINARTQGTLALATTE